MARILGLTYAANGAVFALDESGRHVFQQSVPIGAVTAAVPVGQLHDPTHRVYAGTSDGNIALFTQGPNMIGTPPQLVHVTDAPVLWSLYHAAGVLYLGTGDYQSSGPFPFLALDDRTLAVRWSAASSGPVLYPAAVAYAGNAPQQVLFASGNPNPAVRAFDVATGTELWSAPDVAFGLHVHQGVVYYGDIADNTLRARSTADGTLLWSFRNPQDFNFQRPAVAGGVVWASTVGDQLFALRASDGAVRWEVAIGAHPGTPVVRFDHVLGLALVAVADQDGVGPGFLRGFDANSGAPLWTSSVPVVQAGERCTDPIIIGGDQVQLGTFDGSLATFSGFDGQLNWTRPLTPGSSLIATPHWASY